MKKIEWEVVPRTTYEIVRTEQDERSCGMETFGTFENERVAQDVMATLRTRDPECGHPIIK